MKRRHHFVPQFYLRGFSCDEEEKRIHVYNLRRQAPIKDASLKHQCYRHRFYGKEDDLEDAFGQLEGFAASAIKRVLSSRRGPELGSEDHKALIMFVALQHARTIAAVARTRLALTGMANAAFDGAPPPDYQTSEKEALTLSVGAMPLMFSMLDDLGVHAIVAPDGHRFITSDNPVSRYNHYCYGVKGWGVLGAACRGLQMIVPLAPTVSALLFDRGVYKVGQRGIAQWSIATPADVRVLNQLVFLAADENLYFADWVQSGEVAGLARSVRREARAQVYIKEAVEVGNENSTLLHSYDEQPAIDARLSFVSLRREARRVDPFERVRQYRRPLPPIDLRPSRLADGRKHVFRVRTQKGK